MKLQVQLLRFIFHRVFSHTEYLLGKIAFTMQIRRWWRVLLCNDFITLKTRYIWGFISHLLSVLKIVYGCSLLYVSVSECFYFFCFIFFHIISFITYLISISEIKSQELCSNIRKNGRVRCILNTLTSLLAGNRDTCYFSLSLF